MMCDNDSCAEGGTFVSQRNTDVPLQVTDPDACAANLLPKACTVRQVLDQWGGKWSVSTCSPRSRVRQVLPSSERMVEGISRRMLTLTLRNLERDGLLVRTVYRPCRRRWSTPRPRWHARLHDRWRPWSLGRTPPGVAIAAARTAYETRAANPAA